MYIRTCTVYLRTTGADIHHIKYVVMNVISVTTSLSTFFGTYCTNCKYVNFI